MAIDPYSPCPCGSGKKFKWCCAPIHSQMDKVFQLDGDGQHEAALRLMQEIVAEHPNNAEVHGRLAQLLYQLERIDEAEATLDKAFELNPKYPYGHLLRGRMRMFEQEFAGALVLLRKAVEYYDARAHETMAALQASIAECELRLNRPVACRAALEIAIGHGPGTAAFRENLEKLFGAESDMPISARREYSCKAPAELASPQRKKMWQAIARAKTTGKLADPLRVAEQLVAEDNADAAAWYNLALIKAWLGDNAGSIQALDEYIQREPDEDSAAAAWALAEVLRCGAGLEEAEADYVEHSRTFQIVDGAKAGELINALQQESRLLGARMEPQQNILTGVMVVAPKVLAAGAIGSRTPYFGCHLLIMSNFLRIWGVNRERVSDIGAELEQRAGESLVLRGKEQTPANFADIVGDALVFPLDAGVDEKVDQELIEGIAKYFEDGWVHRPLHSLNGVTPLQAAERPDLKKKLAGVVLFLEECAKARHHQYDFDNLRRKLGLAAGPAEARPVKNIAAMNAAELAALPVESMSDAELEHASQVAAQLDNRDLASTFLKSLVVRPRDPARPDRFPWYTQLIQQAISQRNLDEAMEYVDEGEKADCEHNEGRRRNDYELWRGRVHARRGEVEAAQDVLDRLIARVPSELRYRSTAAETMLSANEPSRALQFAVEGLNEASKQKNRDSQEHFRVLMNEAQKQNTRIS